MNKFFGFQGCSVNFKKPSSGRFEKSKSEVIRDLGFERHQAQRFEILADNPDLVEQVKNNIFPASWLMFLVLSVFSFFIFLHREK